MPRAISPNLRRALEEPRSSEYVVVLLEITHEAIAQPIRVANDVVDYVFEGNTFTGFPFEIEVLGDTADVPRGTIRVQNVDLRMSEAILSLTTPPNLRIILLANSDFSDTLTSGARTPNGTPVPEYDAKSLTFGNITLDATAITGEIRSFDMTSEPWPSTRTTADHLPGLDP